MEQKPSNKIKTTDDKYCSECGELIKVKAELCPHCGVRQLPVPGFVDHITPPDKIKFFCGDLREKYFYSAGIALVSLWVAVLGSLPKNQWFDGLTGSIFLATIVGIGAMAIPTEKKIIYIPISVASIWLIAIIINSN